MQGRFVTYLTSAVILVAVGGCSQPPGFYVVPEQMDLGLVDDDSRTAVAEFQLVNELTRAVEIKQIFPSCTCADVSLLKNPIPPGESTTVRVTANLPERGGKQEVSVLLVTDSADFPTKRISFTALVPATGVRQKHLSIGSFYPGESIDIVIPVRSFSIAAVELSEQASDDEGVTTHLVHTSAGESQLLVKGTAPCATGDFFVDIRFRESVSDEPSLDERTLELRLAGNVVARWDIPRELYCGFFSLRNDGGTIPLTLKGNTALISADRRKTVSTVSVTHSEQWLSLKSQSISSDQIELHFEIHEDKLQQLGAVETAMELTIHYEDGDLESYSTEVYAHISP